MRQDDKRDRPFQTAPVFAPRVLGIQGDYLLCDGNHTQSKSAGTGLLEGFLDLAGGSNDEVLTFAKRWGALNISTKPIPGMKFLEPISTWRFLAGRLSTLRRIGAELNSEKLGSEIDWRMLGNEAPGSLPEGRFGLMSQIRRLVSKAKLRPRLYWYDALGQWQIDHDSESRSNLLAVLTIQLMVTIADKDGAAICSHCHRWYFPSKRPASTKRNYCQREECKRSAWRDSKRELRRKEGEGNVQTKTR